MPFDDSPVQSAPAGTKFSGNSLVSAAANSGASSAPASSFTNAANTALGPASSGAITTATPGGVPGASPTNSGNSYSPLDTSQQKALVDTATTIGAKPDDLYAVINYETSKTFDPGKWGGTNGRYLGIIQFGPTEQRKYGVNPDQSFEDQLGAAAKYLVDRGFKPGMGVAEMYSIINAGSLRKGIPRWNANDGNATVREHVDQITRHFYPSASAPPAGGPPLQQMVNEATPAMMASAVPAGGTLTTSDRNAGPATADLGIMGNRAIYTPPNTPPEPALEPPADMPMSPAQWGNFQRQLQAGAVPWSRLPDSWKTRLTQELGDQAEAGYEKTRLGRPATAIAAVNDQAGATPPPQTMAYAEPEPAVAAPVTAPQTSPMVLADFAAGPYGRMADMADKRMGWLAARAARKNTPPTNALAAAAGPFPARPEYPSAMPAAKTKPVNEDKVRSVAEGISNLATVPLPPQKPLLVRQSNFTKVSESEKGQVAQYQQMLKDLGYYKGEVDGLFGPMTQRAVKAFQKDEGLKIDGKIGGFTRGNLVARTGRSPSFATPGYLTPEAVEEAGKGKTAAVITPDFGGAVRTKAARLAPPAAPIDERAFNERTDPESIGTVPATGRIRPAPSKKPVDMAAFDEMYRSLPPGATYIDPKGVVRRKR